VRLPHLFRAIPEEYRGGAAVLRTSGIGRELSCGTATVRGAAAIRHRRAINLHYGTDEQKAVVTKLVTGELSVPSQ